MAKMFKVQIGEQVQEFTARQQMDAKYAVLPYVNAYGEAGAAEHVTVSLQGEAASIAEFLQACEDAETARIEKKMQTHVYRRVLFGSSAGSYVWQWVKK